MDKILVTGGAGFIGSHIVDQLIEIGHRVIVVDNLSTGNIRNINKKAIFYEIDIRSKDLENIFQEERPDKVIHHAAQIDIQSSINDPSNDADINILGTLNLLGCCKSFNVSKIIYASTAAVYGNPEYLGIDESHTVSPISYYGISKYTPEQYIKTYNELYGLKYTILRYSNVYGPRQDSSGEGGVVAIFLNKAIKNERPLIYGDGEQTRDFIYVGDVANANILALDKGDNEIFNIGTGNSTSVNRLVEVVSETVKSNISPKYVEERKGDIKDSYFNISKAIDILDFSSKTNLVKGISDTYEFYISN